MARMHWIALSLLGLTLTGCVSQDKYTALKVENEQLKSQLGQASSEVNAAKASEAAWKNQVDALGLGHANATAMNSNTATRLETLSAENADLKARYEQLLRDSAKGGIALSPALTGELNAFAAQNPDLVEFDSARGIVKFKSDVTFALGSAELTPQAKSAIDRFAQILNSSSASAHELMVAGHTDNAPVNNPQTIAKGHKNNWYLSAHRAIAVSDELVGQRVSPNRVGVAGYADQRPIAQDRSKNRRVEVMILPTTVKGGPVLAQTGGTAAKAAEPKKAPALNKDTPIVDRKAPVPHFQK